MLSWITFLHSTRSLKQQSMDRHRTPLRQINLTVSQLIYALTKTHNPG